MCNGVPVRTFIPFPGPRIPDRSAGFRASSLLGGGKNVQCSHPGARQGDPRRHKPLEPGVARVDRNVPSLGIVIPLGSRLEIKPHEGWTPKQAETIRLRQQDVLPIPELARRSAPPLKPPPLKAWYQYRCEDPRQQDRRDKQGRCQPTECSGHCPGNGRAHGARPVSRAA